MTNSRIKEESGDSRLSDCLHDRQYCRNYCVSGMLSRCSAGSEWKRQKKCRFYVKSTFRDRCMYFSETLDGHCDCVDAQREVRRNQEPEK